MSYDLAFVRRAEGASWDEAFAAHADADADGRDAGAPDAGAWARIVAEVRPLLGEVEVDRAERSFALDHDPTGIQLSLYAEEAAITVPYWHRGEAAAAVVGLVYRIAAIVERHTGMQAYDGQLGMAVAEAARTPELAAAVFDEVASSFARRGIAGPGNA